MKTGGGSEERSSRETIHMNKEQTMLSIDPFQQASA